MASDNHNPPPHVCAVCGKQFYHDSDEYVYKRTTSTHNTHTVTIWFCSWGCLRAWEREQESLEEQRRKEREERRRAERERQEQEAREKQITAAKGSVHPIIEIKPRYTIHRCGVCGRQIAMTATHCKSCGTKINWSVYGKE